MDAQLRTIQSKENAQINLGSRLKGRKGGKMNIAFHSHLDDIRNGMSKELLQ